MRKSMQTDLATLNEDTIKTIAKKSQLSEEDAQTLIQQEMNGRGRKFVLKTLATQARNAKRRRNLEQVQGTGILLPTVGNRL